MRLSIGGSYAYGTNNEGSDIDFRGVTLQLLSNLVGFTEFEHCEDDKTDTAIYDFNKLVKLLLECNTNIYGCWDLTKTVADTLASILATFSICTTYRKVQPKYSLINRH